MANNKTSILTFDSAQSNDASCLGCAQFFTCKDPLKSGAWKCIKFESLNNANTDDLLVQAQAHIDLSSTMSLEFANDKDIQDEIGEFESMIAAALSSNRLIPLDLNVDDRDIPEAKSYYDWCYGKLGIKFNPFARQLWIAAKLFGEMCPRCSDPKWYNNIENVPVDYKAVNMKEHVSFLEYGVCPDCGGGRSEMFKTGELNIYQELAICLGQRSGKCLTHDTLILTEDGVKTIGDMRPANAKRGRFVPFKANLIGLNGETLKAAKYYVNPPEMLYRVTTRDGKHVDATANHKLWTTKGWVRVADLDGDVIPVRVGQNVWGKTVPNTENAAKEAREKEKSQLYVSGNARKYYSGNLSLHDCKVLGLFVAEGSAHKAGMTTTSEVSQRNVLKAMAKWFGSNHFSFNGHNYVGGKASDEVWLSSVLGSNGYSAERHVPPCIMSAPREYVSAFLQGYFEGDGGWDGGDVFCGSNSQQFIREISVLLGNMGVTHRIGQKESWATNGSATQETTTSHQIHVAGSALTAFRDAVGFLEVVKRNRLDQTIEYLENRQKPNPYLEDIYPNEFKVSFRRLIEMVRADLKNHTLPRKGKGGSIVQQRMGLNRVFDCNHKFWRINHKDVSLTRHRINMLNEGLENFRNLMSVETLTKLEEFVDMANDSNLYYTTVVSVEPLRVDESYDFEVPGQHCFMANGLLNHNSIQTGGLASYSIHKGLKTVRPAEHYGLASSTTLSHTYTALQYKRAYSLLWTPIRDTITDSPWFRTYHDFLKQEGYRLGEELVTVKDTFINWRRSRLIAAPAAPNIGTLRGDTRQAAAIDELGFFKFGAGAEEFVTISADEIHASLSNSLATVRTAASRMLKSGENNIQQGIMFNLSSPSSVFDKIMTLVRASVNSRVLLGVRLPTWEMNPLINREDLQIYWDTNAVKAERDFGANPPLAAAPFFADQDKIAALFTGQKNRIEYEVVERTNNQGVLERGVKILRTQEMVKQPPSLMTLDSGVSNNSFSLSISIPVVKGVSKPVPRMGSSGYTAPRRGNTPLAEVRIRNQEKLRNEALNRPLDINSENGENVRCQTLLTVEIIPPKGGRINFNQMFKKLMVPLLKPFNVQALVTDRWQNILMLDQMRDEHNIATFQYSLRYPDFEAIRSYAEGGRLQLPALESRSIDEVLTFDQESYPYCFEGKPIDHMALQFLTVQDTGRTVDKGPNLTDDSFRSVALAMHYLRDIVFIQQFLSGTTTQSGKGGGLVASGGGDSNSSQGVHSMTGMSHRALVATGGGGGESGSTFSASSRK